MAEKRTDSGTRGKDVRQLFQQRFGREYREITDSKTGLQALFCGRKRLILHNIFESEKFRKKCVAAGEDSGDEIARRSSDFDFSPPFTGEVDHRREASMRRRGSV